MGRKQEAETHRVVFLPSSVRGQRDLPDNCAVYLLQYLLMMLGDLDRASCKVPLKSEKNARQQRGGHWPAGYYHLARQTLLSLFATVEGSFLPSAGSFFFRNKLICQALIWVHSSEKTRIALGLGFRSRISGNTPFQQGLLPNVGLWV